MTPPLPQVFQESDERMVERRSPSSGEALMNLALALMNEVKNDLGTMKSEWKSEMNKMSEKLDKLGDERREEAREHGELEARLKALETFRADTESSQRAIRMLAFSSLFAAGGALLMGFLKLAMSHPEVIK